MQILPTQDNFSERLNEIKANTGYAEFIRDFALKLRTERHDVTQMVKSMESVMMSRVVSKWAEPSNIIGNTAGVDHNLTLEQTKKAYVDSKNENEKTELVGIGEFGDLKSFDVEKNNNFLDKLKNETEVIDTSSDLMLNEAQKLVDSLALDNPITDNRFRADDYQFGMAA